MSKVCPIIQPTEFAGIMQESSMLLFDVSNDKEAIKMFEQEHLVGAQFVNVNAHLAEIPVDFKNGGRHPLPTPEKFSKTIQLFGISEDSHIVIYDRVQGANAAARFWWMLKSAGIEKVQILDGGFQAAQAAGIPTACGDSISIEKSTFRFSKWLLPLVYRDEVKEASEKRLTIIDVRSPERFNGTLEPIDLVAGHIPNALNIPLMENLDENGFFLSPEKLKDHFEQKIGNLDSENWIVHCGSGVTACHTLLACDYAGLQSPKLYVGSWSEWSRNF